MEVPEQDAYVVVKLYGKEDPALRQIAELLHKYPGVPASLSAYAGFLRLGPFEPSIAAQIKNLVAGGSFEGISDIPALGRILEYSSSAPRA